MAFTDRPIVARLTNLAEQRLGVTVRPTKEIERLAVMEQEFADLASDAEELALQAFDYFSGRPHEFSHERRKRIAQKSRVALKLDPLAGAEAQLLADFAFGKGVQRPTARDPKVQEIIDAVWADSNNVEKLTGFQAQRKLSNELLTAGELFITGYAGGGHYRVGRLDADDVVAVVPDPEDRLRPLWYMARERRFEWDFENDQPKFELSKDQAGQERMRYWKHWRNYDEAVKEREGQDTSRESPLETPPASKLADGVVYHVAINQTGEELRGNPPWARSLRYFTAMSVLTEAHVVMAQGASTFIARRVMKGSPKQVTRAASSVLGHISELGAGGRFEGGRQGSENPAAFVPGGPPPMPPGSWWNENESSRLEAMSLNSGAGQMAQTAQIVRAPVAAASGFGQHYFGDASNANLATASTLELPATMRVVSWQQHAEDTLRWFTDRAIEAAVRSGRLGGMDDFPEAGPMGELRLDEAEDRREMERRTGIDLSYEFVMPFPGRRQLPDVATFVSTMRQTFDPNGVSIPFGRQMLRFAFEQMGIDDVGHAVEEAIPEEATPGGWGPQPEPVPVGPDGLPIPGAAARAGSSPGEGSGDQLPGVKTGTAVSGPASEQEWIPVELRPAAAEFEGETAARFRRHLDAAAALASVQVAAGNSNGLS